MKKFFRSLLIILLVMSQSVYASLWGSGAYYGNAHCPYDEDDGDRYDAEYYIENDETLEEYRDKIALVKEDLNKAKGAMREAKRDARAHEKKIKKVLTEDAFEDGVRFHFEQKACPGDYRKESCETGPPSAADAVADDAPTGAVGKYSPANQLDYAMTPFRFFGLGFPKPAPLVIDEVPERAPVGNIARQGGAVNRAPADVDTSPTVDDSNKGKEGQDNNSQQGGTGAEVEDGTNTEEETTESGATTSYGAKILELIINKPIESSLPVDRDSCGSNTVWDSDQQTCVEDVSNAKNPDLRDKRQGTALYAGATSTLDVPKPFCQPHGVQGASANDNWIQNFNYWIGPEEHFNGVNVGGEHIQCSGEMLPTVCDIHTRAKQIIEPDAGEIGSRERKKCKRELKSWYKDYQKYLDKAAEVEELEDDLAELEEWLEDGIDEIEWDISEGNVPCLSGDCPKNGTKKKRNGLWKSIAAIAGGTFLTGYLGKRAVDQSTRAGFPAPPLTYAAMGWPFIQAGLNGLMGGSWGCSDTMYNQGGAGSPFGPYGMMTGGLYPQVGGVFGYPGGMFGNPMGGGMYMPGMSPFGMPGPWGGYMPFPSGFPGAGGIGANLGLNSPFGPLSSFYPYNVGGMGPFPQAGGWGSPFFPQAGMIPGYPGAGGFTPLGYGNPLAGGPLGTPFSPFGSPYAGGFGSPYGSPYGQFGNPLGNYGQAGWNPYANPYGTPYGGQFGGGLQAQIQQQYLASQQNMLALSAQQMQRESQRASQLNVLYQDYARLTAQIQALNSGSIYTGGIPFGGVTGGIFGGVSGGISLPGLNIGGSLYGGFNSGFLNGTSFPAGGPFRQVGPASGIGAGRPPSSGTPR